ncbi:carboxymuconolactone decarboxylase family protein [uncultured Friedmanniella sp.]|uniref:carboxymuconolactone decarboxylase family protein n=1 Tax=uncultured Friedmanniella sp. TaxID=335381 RepID=UPI0035CB6812
MSATTRPIAVQQQARVPLQHRRTLVIRAIEAWSRRRYGAVLQPGLVAMHNRRVLTTLMRTETSAARWNTLDPTVRGLATLAAAAAIGCEWCLDFGYWQSRHEGVPAAKLTATPHWRDAAPGTFTERERCVLGYAEAMTATPPQVTDELVAALGTWFDHAQVVELTALVALENWRSRTNAAMGLTGQGFRDQCDLPERTPA